MEEMRPAGMARCCSEEQGDPCTMHFQLESARPPPSTMRAQQWAFGVFKGVKTAKSETRTQQDSHAAEQVLDGLRGLGRAQNHVHSVSLVTQLLRRERHNQSLVTATTSNRHSHSRKPSAHLYNSPFLEMKAILRFHSAMLTRLTHKKPDREADRGPWQCHSDNTMLDGSVGGSVG